MQGLYQSKRDLGIRRAMYYVYQNMCVHKLNGQLRN